jgi:hypothetical protein
MLENDLMGGELSIPIRVAEQGGFRRTGEPVTVGIPFPEGAAQTVSDLTLFAPDGIPCLSQIEVLARWGDGSIKWALVDFQADVAPGQKVEYFLRRSAVPVNVAQPSGLIVRQAEHGIEVDTGSHHFEIDPQIFRPFGSVAANHVAVLDAATTRIQLVGADGCEYSPMITSFAVETAGLLRTTLKIEGSFCGTAARPFADFISRLSLFLGSGTVEIKLTLRNSRPASHPGGLWDLGDEGSIYFKELRFDVGLKGPRVKNPILVEQPGGKPVGTDSGHFELYQDSSGSDYWKSSNHVDRFGRVNATFRGYRVTVDGTIIQSGLRANPTASICTQFGHLSATIEKFWQNFPKAIEVEDDVIRLGLFPRQYSAPYELQGGEQKTHTVYVTFAPSADNLYRAHNKLVVAASPTWCTGTGAVPYLSVRDLTSAPETVELLEELVDTAVKGTNTFFDRREVIDEYGWRNFGDIYADHEAVGHQGDAPLVAHYNNQYDVLHGALFQYLRSGDGKWFELADDLVRHVIDIDIYHTNADRKAFNGGLFWHTQHYTDAATCTHRAYSKASVGSKSRHQSGGGPSSEHNYTTGLMEYYFLTGDAAAKEAVVSLGDWVINMDAPAGGVLGALDRRPRGLCSMTVSRDYHGPGRGCGNSINALLDSYTLTKDGKYWRKAEELIRRSVHPKDDIESRNLKDVEHRWSYTVFLQALGKYLDSKIEYGQIDFMYAYARESLLHYARWMVDHEVPYSSVLNKVEIPTETWPAQDIRKSNVFKFAAKHSDGLSREQFLERSRFFFDSCVRDVLKFDTCVLTRPVVLLMTNGFMHSYYMLQGLQSCPIPSEDYRFGAPRTFRPQFHQLYQLRELLQKLLQLLTAGSRQMRARLWGRYTTVANERA